MVIVLHKVKGDDRFTSLVNPGTVEPCQKMEKDGLISALSRGGKTENLSDNRFGTKVLG